MSWRAPLLPEEHKIWIACCDKHQKEFDALVVENAIMKERFITIIEHELSHWGEAGMPRATVMRVIARIREGK